MSELTKWVAVSNLSKAYKDDSGRMHVTAIASDSQTDLEGDAMSRPALESMVQQFKKGVDLIDNHRSTFAFVRTIDAQLITEKGQTGDICWKVLVDIELDDSYPEARALFREVQENRCNKQLSIGGSVPHTEKGALGVSLDKSGKMIRSVNKVNLDHLACTRKDMAANPRTGFLAAVLKSLDEANAFEDIVPETVESKDEEIDNTEVEGVETDELTKDISIGTNFLARIGKLVKTGGEAMGRMMKDITEDQDQFPIDELIESEGDENLLEDEVVMEGEGDVEVVTEGDLEGEVCEGVTEVTPEVDEVVAEDVGLTDDDFMGELMEDGIADEEIVEEEVPVAEVDKGMEELEQVDEALEYDVDTDEDYTEEELMAAKAVLKERKKRLLAKQRKVVNLSSMISEIQLLAQNSHLAKGLDPKRSSKMDVLLAKALGNIRFLIAKSIVDSKGSSPEIRNMARIIKEQGPFAPGGDFTDNLDDKAQGDTDIATDSTTGSEDQPVYADFAELSPEELDPEKVMTQAVKNVGTLQPTGENEEFGKSRKVKQNAVLAAQKKAMMDIAKSMDKKFLALQEVIKKQNKTIAQLKGTGGISKSRNRARMTTVQKSLDTNNVFTGLFDAAIARSGRRK